MVVFRVAPRGDDTRPFTARLPGNEYETLKAYAFFTGSTLSDVVVRAIREFLARHGREADVEGALDETRRVYRQTIDRLNEP